MKLVCPHCPGCDGTAFHVRAMKDEAVGLATCAKCERSYLLLDSGDYWFDLIQERYPREARCPCRKSKGLALELEYYFREDGEVESVNVWTVCAKCGKRTRRFTADIDYGDTAHLLDSPLVYCASPKIRYDLRQLTLFVTPQNVAQVAQHLGSAQCVFVTWVREGKAWVRREPRAPQLSRYITKARVLRTYASLEPAALEDADVAEAKDEAAFWKQREIIRISSPTNYCTASEQGTLFYIDYSLERLEGEHVVRKSEAFCALAQSLEEWLAEQFVSWRGPRSFDNPDEHRRLFGARFRPL